MRLNFGKGEHSLPHFYYCSVAKWILQFYSDPLFVLAAKWFIIITIFATITFVLASFLPFPSKKKTQTKLRLFHGCSNKIKVGEGSKIKNWRKNGNYDWLFGYLVEAKITMELWESEIRAGPFCDRESAKSTVKSVGGDGGGDVISHLCQIFFFGYAFERMNTSKMTEIERTGKNFFFPYFLCIMY